MAYITASDLLTRSSAEELAQLADRSVPRIVTADLLSAAVAGADLSGWSEDEQSAAADALAVVAQAIDDAQSMIDGYLASRYITPLPTPPAAVQRLACDMARYYLYADNATEAIQKRYDAAIAFFRDVSAGKVTLGAEVEASQPVSGTVHVASGCNAFSRNRRGL